MNASIYKIVIIAVVLCGICFSLRADEHDDGSAVWDQKHSDAVHAEFKRRATLLETEIESGGLPDWAGDYQFGDGLGVNIRLVVAPRGGFVYSWTGCMGVYDRNFGTVAESGDIVSLTYELPNGDRGNPDAPREFVPVRWGDRHYLLRPGEFDDFVNDINAGFEPCDGLCGRFLLRNGDAGKPPFGRPGLPEKDLAHLRDQPIDAHVVRILDSESEARPEWQGLLRTTTVELDVGAEAGVWEGMRFLSMSSRRYLGENFIVKTVSAGSSIAAVREINPRGEPETGVCLSTKLLGTRCPDDRTKAQR